MTTPVETPYRSSAPRVTLVRGHRQKSAPVALQRQTRGLADRKDTDRLMSTVPSRPMPSPEPWALVDGCPACVGNVEAPMVWVAVDGGHRCSYQCADCGHSWTTSWGA